MPRTVFAAITEPTGQPREGLTVLFVAPGGATAVLRLAATLR